MSQGRCLWEGRNRHSRLTAGRLFRTPITFGVDKPLTAWERYMGEVEFIKIHIEAELRCFGRGWTLHKGLTAGDKDVEGPWNFILRCGEGVHIEAVLDELGDRMSSM